VHYKGNQGEENINHGRDICTKCLPEAMFEYLRKKLIGW